MRVLTWISTLSLLLSGCTALTPPHPGISEAELIVIKGKPDIIYQEGNQRRLEWSATEWGQYAYLAYIDQNGKLISYMQVLTDERFASLQIGKSTMSDVIRTVGRVPKWNRWVFNDGEKWSYRYKENGVWDAMITIYFDKNGIIESIENHMDPLLLRD